jgi:hypothetical protein
MSEGGLRDQDTIERELRMLAGVRGVYRERGGAMPSIDQMDALLDELIALRARGRHRREEDSSADWPRVWR